MQSVTATRKVTRLSRFSQSVGGAGVGGADDEVRIEWGVMPHRGGWLPIYWVNGQPKGDTYGRPLDKGEALARAEAEAREHAERYSGDWTISIEPRGVVDEKTIEREHKEYRRRVHGGGGVGGGLADPFAAIAQRDRRDARYLAMAFTDAHSQEDVIPGLRMVHKLTGRELFGYLDGRHFPPRSDDSSRPWPPAVFEELRELAFAFQGERG